MDKNTRFWIAIAAVSAAVGYMYISDHRVNVDCAAIADIALKKYNLENQREYQLELVTEACRQGVSLAKARGTTEEAAKASMRFVEDKVSGEKTNGAKFSAYLEGYRRESSFH